MDSSFLERLYEEHQGALRFPSRRTVTDLFQELVATLFPEFHAQTYVSFTDFKAHLERLQIKFAEILHFDHAASLDHKDQVIASFFERLEYLHATINKDIAALESGDPAAQGRHEIIRSYPGFYAIAAYRIAHELHQLQVPIIPRMITEHAHSQTGIDIHPGASIGEYFCIDHGTGIVIGETSVIGAHVKIYQGVTLGALSVRKEDASKKRHPTIEDHVVLYSGATILGGDTVIGHHSVIGGNVWITKSVGPFSKVYYQAKMHYDNKEELDMLIYKIKE